VFSKITSQAFYKAKALSDITKTTSSGEANASNAFSKAKLALSKPNKQLYKAKFHNKG